MRFLRRLIIEASQSRSAPASTTSCVVIPDDDTLKRGDIINIDVTVIKDGYHGDTSKMFKVGEVKPFADRLIQITQECMYEGIGLVKPGVRLGDIGFVIQTHVEKHFFSVVEEFWGMASEKFSTKIHKCSITDDQNRARRKRESPSPSNQ